MPEDQLTARAPVSGHPDLIELHFREWAPVRIPLRTFVDMSCKVGMPVSQEFYDKLHLAAEAAEAREYILKRLTRRALTVWEVEHIFRKNGVVEEVSRVVVTDLKHDGLLSDQTYAENYAASKGKRLSRAELLWRLSQRGISREIAEEAVQQACGDDGEYDAALLFAMKFWKRHEKNEPPLRRQKLGAHLQRRGFSAAVIRRVLKALDNPLS